MKKVILTMICLGAIILAYAQPTITSFSPTSGPIGATVTITGTNFNTTLANNIVYFGATKATVSAGSASSLTVKVPIGATYQPITVTNLSTGLTSHSTLPFIVANSICPQAINENSFDTKIGFKAGSGTSGISAGDMDGDGKADIVVANMGSNSVSVFRNTGGSGAISLASKVDFTTLGSPRDVKIVDIDGDGKLDICVGYSGSSMNFSVLRNTSTSGNIAFAAKVDYTLSLPGGPNFGLSINFGDFNGDGKIDISFTSGGYNICCNYKYVSIFRNTSIKGSISFAANINFITDDSPKEIKTGDIDGDGKTDVIVNYSSGVSVHRNTSSTGTISFAARININYSREPYCFALGDMDGDSKTDILLTNAGNGTRYGNGPSVLRNTSSSGSISFATIQSFDSKIDVVNSTLTLGDLNGDGKVDLSLTNYSVVNYPNYIHKNITIYNNNSQSGSISFNQNVEITTPNISGSYYSGMFSPIFNCDIDGDGMLDLILSSSTDSIFVYRNIQKGCPPKITSFSPTSGPIGTTVTIAGTNFNTTLANNIVYFGATKAKLISGSSTSIKVEVPKGASYQPITLTDFTTSLSSLSAVPFNVTFNCGGELNSTSFGNKIDSITGSKPSGIVAADFDGDGKNDLVISNYNSNSISVYRNSSNGSATSFENRIDFGCSNNPDNVYAVDIDGDGKTDLAVVGQYITGGKVSIFRNNSSLGKISFEPKIEFIIGSGTDQNKLSFGDFDGDGMLDMMVVWSNYYLDYYINTGSAGKVSFAPRKNTTQYGFGIGGLLTGDFDGDGKTDIAYTGRGSGIFINRNTTSNSGPITFASPVGYGTGKPPSDPPASLSASDFDGDGKIDIAITNYGSNTVSVFRNTSSIGTISMATKIDYAIGSQQLNSISISQGIDIADLDGDNKPDIAITNIGSNTVSILKNTGSPGKIAFDSKIDFNTGSGPSSVSLRDMNGDGKTDICVTNSGSNTYSLFLNKVSSPRVVANSTAIELCLGANVTLTGTGSANKYIWSGGIVNGTPFLPSIGTKTYTVRGTDTVSGCQNTDSIKITVRARPTVTANASAYKPCPGDSIVLNGFGAKSYLWSGNVKNGIKFIPPAGKDTFRLIGSDPEPGCQDTATVIIDVMPVVTILATKDTVCSGEIITLSGLGTDKYSWDGGVVNGIPFTPPVGVNTYTVTGTDSSTKCSNKASVNILVWPLPISTITATELTKCSGPCDGTATANITSGTAPYTFLWSNGQTTATASPLCQKNYGLIVTDVNGCTDTNSITMKVVRTIANTNIYLTNLAAVDQVNVSPVFSTFYNFNLPPIIIPNTSNPRNFVDPGKKARFKIECTNKKVNGQSIVSGICKVRSSNPYITITDSSSGLNNIGWNNKAWSSDEFEIDIDKNTPSGQNAYIDFIVQENGQDFSTTCIAIPITPLIYSKFTPSTIDDDNNPDSKGNDNDICEPNETIEFYPLLDNISTLNAEYVRGRFENLEKLSYIKIWNGISGINTTVYDAGWWNYAFAKPQVINSSSQNTSPEYDFVFDYQNTNIVNDFKLHMVMAGGFKLFSGSALSLVQWTLPYTFNASKSSSINSTKDTQKYINVFPNPTSSLLTIQFPDFKSDLTYSIINSVGQIVSSGILSYSTSIIDISQLTNGIYLLKIGNSDQFSVKIIKQ